MRLQFRPILLAAAAMAVKGVADGRETVLPPFALLAKKQ